MSFITQRGATGPLSLQAGGSFQQSDDANLATLVGTRWDLSDGREVVLVKAGATTISTAGTLVQNAAVVPNHQDLAVSSPVAYSANGNIPASCLVTLGATAATQDQYQGGFAIINSSVGIGQTLRIATNSAKIASGTIAIVFEDGPNTALTTASKVSLWPAYGLGVITSPTTPTNSPVGVTLYPITASQYGFVTAKGTCSARSDAGVPTVGQSIGCSVTTAGTITANGATTASIGYAAQTAVSAEARAVFINL